MAKVFLSAGHGGSDPGACANGLVEKTINLNTLLTCRSELVRHGVTVVASRTSDANDPVQEEVQEANLSGADIVVSFHANAGGGDGFEAYYWSSDSNGRRLAQLGEKYVKQLGQNSRGCKAGDHLMFVRETHATAVLFESFFLDNYADKAIGDTVAEQKAFGVAYAKAILEYLGIAYKSATATTKKDEVLSMEKSELATTIWGYTNKNLEKVDAYQILRDIRDEVVELRKEVAALKEAK